MASKKEPINKLHTTKSVFRYIFFTLILITVNLILGISTVFPSMVYSNVNSPVEGSKNKLVGPLELSGWDGVSDIKSISLEAKYQRLGDKYYAPNMKLHLKVIDKVLKEKKLDQNKLFIQMMFYIGQQESHWRENAVSGTPIMHCKDDTSSYVYGRVSSCAKGDFAIHHEYATGIFQFLPSTFRRVSKGDIFDAEDQIRAYITMVETGRIDEYETFFVCNYGPCLSDRLKVYILLYPKLSRTSFNNLIAT